MGIKTLLSRTVLITGMVTLCASAGSVDEPFEVGTWADFAKGAISHTFDDNTPGQLSKGVPLFNEFGFHMTLFSSQKFNPDWNGLKKAFEEGHEIGSHGVSHSNPSPPSEFAPSQKTVQQKTGDPCVSYAYPNCKNPGGATNVYIAARTCASNTPNSKSPKDWGNINSKGLGAGQGGYPNDANSFNSYADAAANQNGWAVGLHHGVGNGDHSWGSTDVDALKQHLEYLDENRDKIWVETFGNVARYIYERDAATVKKKESNDKSITVEITDDLDDEIFDFPLSIRLPVEDDWDTPSVKQGDKEIEDTIITFDNKEYLMFKAVPDGGDVVITTKEGTDVKNRVGFNSSEAPITRIRSSLIINRQEFAEKVSVTLFNLSGKTIARYTLGSTESTINLQNSTCVGSAFIARVTDGVTTYSHLFTPWM